MLHKCDICGTKNILNVRAQVGATRKKTKLKNMEILEVIDIEDFKKCIQPSIREALSEGKTEKELKEYLMSNCGMCGELADDAIKYLKSVPQYVKMKNDKFILAEELTAQLKV